MGWEMACPHLLVPQPLPSDGHPQELQKQTTTQGAVVSRQSGGGGVLVCVCAHLVVPLGLRQPLSQLFHLLGELLRPFSRLSQQLSQVHLRRRWRRGGGVDGGKQEDAAKASVKERVTLRCQRKSNEQVSLILTSLILAVCALTSKIFKGQVSSQTVPERTIIIICPP